MTQGLVTVSYIGASMLCILALGGLSLPATSRRGNFYGMLGMLIALTATVFGIVSGNYLILYSGVIVGGSMGLVLAKKVAMTQMPELVAILHSLVGLAAVLVGLAGKMDLRGHVYISYLQLPFCDQLLLCSRLVARSGFGCDLGFPGQFVLAYPSFAEW